MTRHNKKSITPNYSNVDCLDAVTFFEIGEIIIQEDFKVQKKRGFNFRKWFKRLRLVP